MPGVTGCLIADRSGLCLGCTYFYFTPNLKLIFFFLQMINQLFLLARGNLSSNCAGMIAAIMSQASKLEPDMDPPVVLFENESRYTN